MSDARNWAVYDRPDLRAAVASCAHGVCEVLIALDGMHCAGCAARAERLLAGAAQQVRVNLVARTVGFGFRPEQIRLSTLLQRLDQAGLQPRVLARQDGAQSAVTRRRLALARIGVATICAAQVMMLAWPSYFGVRPQPEIERLLRWAQWLIATPGVLWAGWPFFAGAAAALRVRMLNMDVPVALALAGTYAASVLHLLQGAGDLYFDTATMLVWFLSIGRHLEGRTRAYAIKHLRLLAGRRTLTAQRVRGGTLETVPLEALTVGDEVVVAPGDTLPADGALLGEAAELDESLLTGEAGPVLQRPSASLLAGSVNVGRAPLRLRVDHAGGDTRLAQITRLLDRAQTQKPRLQQFTDRIAGHFIAGVLAFAALGFALALRRGAGSAAAFDIALAVLVASCPCALSLAVPAALAAATSRLAASGLLVADATALQRLTGIDTVLFDKTGTLTRPHMRIARAGTFAALTLDACLEIAAALERGSRHPIAAAFAEITSARQATALDYTAGAGISGEIDGRRYWLGAVEPATGGLQLPVAAAVVAGQSTVVLSDAQDPLAWFALDNEPRPEARQVLGELSRRGLAIEILSGDAAGPVATLARRLGVGGYRARQTPQQKLERLQVQQRDGHRVLAVGDGVNDAPLLAAADVSAALPQGAALTQARADLLLLGDTLEALPQAIDVARRTRRRIRENLVWAAAYNLLVLPLALAGELAPWLAAAGMSLSSLLVVANALRVGDAGTPDPRHRRTPAPVIDMAGTR
ncbi:MAG: cadmium-translocating P-type ATPase [Gammaproteobacteria bacterium]|nr:cadmium-translocating P-type ATPase [Gammaproteobacteria bacterium]